jgi:hypothetical protein
VEAHSKRGNPDIDKRLSKITDSGGTGLPEDVGPIATVLFCCCVLTSDRTARRADSSLKKFVLSPKTSCLSIAFLGEPDAALASGFFVGAGPITPFFHKRTRSVIPGIVRKPNFFVH